MVKRTIQVRILTEGLFNKLMDKISGQFEKKHKFIPSADQICEAIASAIEDAKLFR